MYKNKITTVVIVTTAMTLIREIN